MASKLPNYLKTQRRRFGISQREMAYLLGYKSPMDISRFERSLRIPSLQTALAYQAVFGVPVAELFAGFYQKVEKETAKRARLLQQTLKNADSSVKNTRKRDLLRSVEITPAINKEHP